MADVELRYAQLLQEREIRIAASLAAGSSWAGIDQAHNRDAAIINTAKAIEDYIKNG